MSAKSVRSAELITPFNVFLACISRVFREVGTLSAILLRSRQRWRFSKQHFFRVRENRASASRAESAVSRSKGRVRYHQVALVARRYRLRYRRPQRKLRLLAFALVSAWEGDCVRTTTGAGTPT